MDEAWLWPLGLGALGLVFGSFIATLAVRWPEGRSVRGRSECDSCGKALASRELVPVLSYALQRGRCRGCGGRIAPSHPAIELVGLAIGVAAGWIAPGAEGASGAALGWLLLALAALDLAAFWLPNVLTFALAAAGLAEGLLTRFRPPLDERLWGGAIGFVALWLVAWGYRRWRGREGLGGGDPKLMGAIGLWLGWRDLPFVLLTACLVGLIAICIMVLLRRRVRASDRLPFGVLLALAAWATWMLTAPSLFLVGEDTVTFQLVEP